MPAAKRAREKRKPHSKPVGHGGRLTRSQSRAPAKKKTHGDRGVDTEVVNDGNESAFAVRVSKNLVITGPRASTEQHIYPEEIFDITSPTSGTEMDASDPPGEQFIHQETELSNTAFTASECNPDNQPTAFRISDPFHFSADLVSEAEIKGQVEALNYGIDRMLCSIVRSIMFRRMPKFKTLRCDHLLAKGIEPFIEPPNNNLYQLLTDLFPYAPGTKANVTEINLVLQAFLQDQVCRFLHRLFFRGEIFAGVDPKVGEVLENVYKGISDEVPHSVAQRWRALAISASFLQMNEMVLNEKAEALMSIIQSVISIAYPTQKENFNNMIYKEIHKEEVSVRGIIENASKLSLRMQKDMVSTLVKVKIAPEVENEGSDGSYRLRTFDPSNATSAWSNMESRENDLVLGTYSFGVEQTMENGKKWILKPELITASLIRHFDPSFTEI
ncbi:hypothetical protein M413DRAFT_433426 [Hebeloma cylindrosporum]|uniref:Uncharacterized protein n=1 Tax=Hebeloma cylindrosporum TaxID=76867 RepID=A0A0C2YST6_HEBCY|nr:hypothetical protein M413DRAFT_433426 [Hebeloma cylindrosporum h7]